MFKYVGHSKLSAHSALPQPAGRCSPSDIRDSCEPDFSKELRVCNYRLLGPCSAKGNHEMEEDTDWSRISCSDQRSYIKIETLWGNNPTEIRNSVREVCEDSVVDRSTVSRWASPFREGKHPRQPKQRATSNGNGRHICGYRQRHVGRRSTRIMWRNWAWSKHVNRFCLQNHDSKQKRKFVAKWVPHQLSEEQKAALKMVAEELLRRYEAEGEQFLNTTVAIEETWIRDF